MMLVCSNGAGNAFLFGVFAVLFSSFSVWSYCGWVCLKVEGFGSGGFLVLVFSNFDFGVAFQISCYWVFSGILGLVMEATWYRVLVFRAASVLSMELQRWFSRLSFWVEMLFGITVLGAGL